MVSDATYILQEFNRIIYYYWSYCQLLLKKGNDLKKKQRAGFLRKPAKNDCSLH